MLEFDDFKIIKHLTGRQQSVLPLLLKLGDIPTSPTRSKVNRSSYDCMRESENAGIGKV